MMNITVLDGYTLNPGDLSWEGFGPLGKLTVHDRISHDSQEILSAIGRSEVVLTNKTPLLKEVLEKAPNLKYIGVLATGYNVIDIETAKNQGIVVTNVPDYGTEAVAQFTMAMLLEICHHIGEHNRAVQEGEWSRSKDFCFWNYPLVELKGKTMGIIGMGRIGTATAKLAQAFGMHILATGSPNHYVGGKGPTLRVTMDEMLGKADVISLHCPLTPETNGMINARAISKMKDGVILINTSRGGLIVEKDVRVALDQGKIAGVAVDVVSKEPISIENPLYGAPNCIITPHIAWAAKSSRERLMQTVLDNLRSYLSGNPVNVVNR